MNRLLLQMIESVSLSAEPEIALPVLVRTSHRNGYNPPGRCEIEVSAEVVSHAHFPGAAMSVHKINGWLIAGHHRVTGSIRIDPRQFPGEGLQPQRSSL